MAILADPGSRQDHESGEPDSYGWWLNHPFFQNPTMAVDQLPEISARGLYWVMRYQYNRLTTNFIIHQIPTPGGPIPALVGGVPIDYQPDQVYKSMRTFFNWQTDRQPWMARGPGFCYNYENEITNGVAGPILEVFVPTVGLPL